MRPANGHQGPGFLAVLVAALAMFGVSPVLSGSDAGNVALNLFAFAVLVGALWASHVPGRWLRLAALLGGSAWLLTVFAAAGADVLVGPRIIITYALWIAAPIAVLVRVIRDRRITLNTIYGAINAYVLFGLLMGFQYTAIEEIESGSFAIPGNPGDDYTDDLLYYSLVTQTTLGFGDIAPVKAVPRSLSVIQAILGQMYLVVLVARLVAMQVAHAADVEETT